MQSVLSPAPNDVCVARRSTQRFCESFIVFFFGEHEGTLVAASFCDNKIVLFTGRATAKLPLPIQRNRSRLRPFLLLWRVGCGDKQKRRSECRCNKGIAHAKALVSFFVRCNFARPAVACAQAGKCS